MPDSVWPQEAKGALTGAYTDKCTRLRAACHTDLSSDVKVRTFSVLEHEATLFYIDGMADASQVTRYILFPCQTAPQLPEGGELLDHLLSVVLPVGVVQTTCQLEQALSSLFSGDALMVIDGIDGAITLDVKGYASRGIAPPPDETVIVGPHEGFTETLKNNLTLMRRLMRSPTLIAEPISVGTKIPKQLFLLYLKDIAPDDAVEEMRRRIRGCNVDYVSSLGMLEQLIEDNPWSLLPQAASTERPDRAVSFLSEGQIVILMENAPRALALPMGFLHLYHAPDDTAMRWQYGSFLRILRMFGVLIALLLPAVFVSLTIFHPEGMPLSLMTSVTETQAKVPLSLFSSMLLMLLIFGLINEAAVRIPGAMGSSLSIVSGLILGQAAVQADLFSPLVIIVVAVSGLGSYAVPTYSLTLSIRIAQIFLVLISGVAGYLGMILGLFLLLVRLFSLTSMNAPFFSPAAPTRPANPDGVIRLPIWRQRLRGAFANPFRMNKTMGPMRAWDRHEEEK